MPIRKENLARYPKDWKRISKSVREAAGNRCEGSPAFPECRAENGKPHPETGSRVVLTVAHLDHQPENCARDNLRAWCQRCHNVYDAPMRRKGIRERARAALVVAPLLCVALLAPISAPAAACNLPASRLLSLQNPPLYTDTVLASAGLRHRHTVTERPRGGSHSPRTPIVPLPPSLGLLLGAVAVLFASKGLRR